MKKIFLAVSSFIFIATLSTAQEIWVPPHPQKIVLKNGLTVLLWENRSLPAISVDIMVKAGSITDPWGYSGLSNFTAEMLSKGTASRSALDIAESFDFVGAQFSVKCDYDAVFFSLTTLAKDFERTAPILFELLTKPVFDSSETSRLRMELISAIEAKGDRPNVQSAEALDRLLFGKHPYAHPVMGEADNVSLITQKELAAHHKRYYIPNNCIISVAGDFKSSRIKKLIEQNLGHWPKGESPIIRLPEIPKIDNSRALLVNRQINQAYINLGFLGPKRNDPDYQAIRVMNYILGGGGFVSRLVRNIRMVQGLAYDVDSYYDPRTDYGPYALSVQTKCSSADTAVKSLMVEMRRIQNESVSDEELKEAKDYIRGSYPFRFESNGSVARQFLYVELYNLGDDYFKKDMERTLAVTKDDVMAAAKKYLKPDNFMLVMVTDTSQTKLNIPGLNIVKQ
jgi:zinc protease